MTKKFPGLKDKRGEGGSSSDTAQGKALRKDAGPFAI